MGHAKGCSVELGLDCSCSHPAWPTPPAAGECLRCDRAIQAVEGDVWVDAMGSDACRDGKPHQVAQAPAGYHRCPSCQDMHAHPMPDPPRPRRPGVRMTVCGVCNSLFLGGAWCHDLPTDQVVVEVITGPLPV